MRLGRRTTQERGRRGSIASRVIVVRIITALPGFAKAPAQIGSSSAPDPGVGPGDVLIRVGAAGVNPADALQLAGRYPPPPGAPAWPGLEVAGEVVALGKGVTGWQPGDRVAALLGGGGWAELVSVPAAQTLPVPPTMPDDVAAAFPEALATAWSNLVDVGRAGPGDVVLVHGATGGVGTVAAQLAAARGCRVVAVAGGADRAERLRGLLPRTDAVRVVDRLSEDFVEVCAHLGGADVILDVVGAANLGRNVEALALGGRLVVIGTLKGRRGEIDLIELMNRRASLHGTTLRARPAHEKAAIVAAVREHAWPLVLDGTIAAHVHATRPFARAAQALELLGDGATFGKVVLVPPFV